MITLPALSGTHWNAGSPPSKHFWSKEGAG